MCESSVMKMRIVVGLFLLFPFSGIANWETIKSRFPLTGEFGFSEGECPGDLPNAPQKLGKKARVWLKSAGKHIRTLTESSAFQKQSSCEKALEGLWTKLLSPNKGALFTVDLPADDCEILACFIQGLKADLEQYLRTRNLIDPASAYTFVHNSFWNAFLKNSQPIPFAEDRMLTDVDENESLFFPLKGGSALIIEDVMQDDPQQEEDPFLRNILSFTQQHSHEEMIWEHLQKPQCIFFKRNFLRDTLRQKCFQFLGECPPRVLAAIQDVSELSLFTTFMTKEELFSSSPIENSGSILLKKFTENPLCIERLFFKIKKKINKCTMDDQQFKIIACDLELICAERLAMDAIIFSFLNMSVKEALPVVLDQRQIDQCERQLASARAKVTHALALPDTEILFIKKFLSFFVEIFFPERSFLRFAPQAVSRSRSETPAMTWKDYLSFVCNAFSSLRISGESKNTGYRMMSKRFFDSPNVEQSEIRKKISKTIKNNIEKNKLSNENKIELAQTIIKKIRKSVVTYGEPEQPSLERDQCVTGIGSFTSDVGIPMKKHLVSPALEECSIDPLSDILEDYMKELLAGGLDKAIVSSLTPRIRISPLLTQSQKEHLAVTEWQKGQAIADMSKLTGAFKAFYALKKLETQNNICDTLREIDSILQFYILDQPLSIRKLSLLSWKKDKSKQISFFREKWDPFYKLEQDIRQESKLIAFLIELSLLNRMFLPR